MSQVNSSVAEAIADLARAVERLGVRWYLFGAQAALLYGSARLTADIDATVLLDQKETAELANALRSNGYTLQIQDENFVHQTRVLPVVHDRTNIPADIVLGGPGLEELFVSRARPQQIAGIAVPVATPEDLIVMKILAGREKDREDVLAILAAQGADLDVASVRQILGMLEEALGQSDLLPLFESLENAARRR